MFFLRIIYCISLILLFSITVLWGQNASKKRLKESDINIEKLFIEATREKILGNTDEAIALYLEILKKDQENAAVNYELARIYKSQKQFDKAIINAQEAVVLDQFNVYYNKLYANLLEQEANYMKASDLYELLVKEYPDSEKLYFEWASLLSRNNQDEKAIKVYNSLEKRMGISAVVTMRKYKLYLALNKDKKAAMELEKLIHQFPQECDYIIRLANFYAKRKEMDKAKEWYQKALNVDPNNAPANLAMVEFYMQTGDTTRYLQALNSVFESSNYSIKSKLNAFKPLVQRFVKDELIKHEESIVNLSLKLLNNHPSNTKANLMRGDVLFHKSQFFKALKAYSNALGTNKNNLHLWQRVLECLLKTNNYIDLQKTSKEMVELFPSQASSYYYHGVALFYQKKYQLSAKELKQSLNIGGSENAETLERFGDVQFMLGEIEIAVSYWKKSLEKGSSSTVLQRKISTKQLYE